MISAKKLSKEYKKTRLFITRKKKVHRKGLTQNLTKSPKFFLIKKKHKNKQKFFERRSESAKGRFVREKKKIKKLNYSPLYFLDSVRF